MLQHIPSIAQHVSDDMNTVLINAVFNKQWMLVSELLMLPHVQNNFDGNNFQFIAQEMKSAPTEIKGMVSHLLLSIPIVHDFLAEKFDAENFRDFTEVSEGYATLVLGEKFIAERKTRNYAPSFPQGEQQSKYRKLASQADEEVSKVEEIYSEDEDYSAAHSNKRRRI